LIDKLSGIKLSIQDKAEKGSAEEHCARIKKYSVVWEDRDCEGVD
jgi:hypothetical protein